MIININQFFEDNEINYDTLTVERLEALHKELTEYFKNHLDEALRAIADPKGYLNQSITKMEFYQAEESTKIIKEITIRIPLGILTLHACIEMNNLDFNISCTTSVPLFKTSSLRTAVTINIVTLKIQADNAHNLVRIDDLLEEINAINGHLCLDI